MNIYLETACAGLAVFAVGIVVLLGVMAML